MRNLLAIRRTLRQFYAKGGTGHANKESSRCFGKKNKNLYTWLRRSGSSYQMVHPPLSLSPRFAHPLPRFGHVWYHTCGAKGALLNFPGTFPESSFSPKNRCQEAVPPLTPGREED
jgi:hypothetical protein